MRLDGSGVREVGDQFIAVALTLHMVNGNIRMTGSLNPMVTTCRLCAIDLPVRRKNGTPFQRVFSTSARNATNVSVWEFGATPGSSRYPSY